MRPAPRLELAGRRNSIPTSCEIDGNAPFPGCLSRIADGYSGAHKKSESSLRTNSQHQCLRIKKVHGREPIYSARVALGYRALGFLEGDDISWFWIGAHADFDRLLARL